MKVAYNSPNVVFYGVGPETNLFRLPNSIIRILVRIVGKVELSIVIPCIGSVIT